MEYASNSVIWDPYYNSDRYKLESRAARWVYVIIVELVQYH